jgi:hypothetical protein
MKFGLLLRFLPPSGHKVMRVFFRADGGRFFFYFQASIICCDASGFSLMSLVGFCFGEIDF